MAGLVVSIIGLSLVIMFGFFMIGCGIYYIKQKEIEFTILSVLVMFMGDLIIALAIIGLFNVYAAFRETTAKVISKGCIESIISEQVTDKDIIDSSKTYYIKIDSGEKIILSEEEWDKVTNEYTYIPIEAEYIEED
jgi:hypothetical protein